MDESDLVTADRQAMALSHGGDLSALVNEFAREFSGTPVTLETALEMVAFLQEKWGAPGVAGSNVNCEGFRLKAKLVDIFEVLLLAESERASRTNKNTAWVLDDPLLNDLLHGKGPADWCAESDKTKQTEYKAAEAIRKKLGLPKRKTQRSDASCQKMSGKRFKELPAPASA